MQCGGQIESLWECNFGKQGLLRAQCGSNAEFDLFKSSSLEGTAAPGILKIDEVEILKFLQSRNDN